MEFIFKIFGFIIYILYFIHTPLCFRKIYCEKNFLMITSEQIYVNTIDFLYVIIFNKRTFCDFFNLSIYIYVTVLILRHTINIPL